MTFTKLRQQLERIDKAGGPIYLDNGKWFLFETDFTGKQVKKGYIADIDQKCDRLFMSFICKTLILHAHYHRNENISHYHKTKIIERWLELFESAKLKMPREND